jgi:hypothetical protein
LGAISVLVREAWDEVRSLDLGLTRDHVRTLTRMGLALAGLSVLVLLTVGVRVANDRLELSNRRSAQQMKLLQKEGDRLALELQARRGAPQMEAVIQQLGLAAAPELEMGPDGTVQRARMAPALRVQPIVAPAADAAGVVGPPSGEPAAAKATPPAASPETVKAARAPAPSASHGAPNAARDAASAPAVAVNAAGGKAVAVVTPSAKPAVKVEPKPSAKQAPAWGATSVGQGATPTPAVRVSAAVEGRRAP